jgi:replication-associated recombination protein RarA
MQRLSLFEQYRPATWAQVVGQDKALKQIDIIRKRRGTLGGQAYFLSGSSGTGKTTIARLIAAEVSDDWATEEFDASGLTADCMERIARDMQFRPLGKGRAYIVNEVHGLNAVQVRKLLSLIEPAGGLPDYVVFVFTTTVEGKQSLFDGCDDSSPFLSRCAAVSLARRDLCKPFAVTLVSTCRQAGLLNGHPDAFYLTAAERVLKDNRNNLRAAYQWAEAGGFEGGDA